MNEKLNPDSLEQQAVSEEPTEEQVPDPMTADAQEPYVERPRGQRVFAWILAGIVILGVILYYFWIARGGKL